MLYRYSEVFRTGLFVIDALLVAVSWLAAYAVRFYTGLPAPLGIPDRDLYLEMTIEALGGTAVEYDGARRCCGFPVITMNRETSLRQAGAQFFDEQVDGRPAARLVASFSTTPEHVAELLAAAEASVPSA